MYAILNIYYIVIQYYAVLYNILLSTLLSYVEYPLIGI